MPDNRAKFIADKIIALTREASPNLPVPEIDEDQIEVIEFGLKIFDAFLPMLVSHVVREYNRQKGDGRL